MLADQILRSAGGDEQRIEVQSLVVGDVFVVERNVVDALRNERRKFLFDQIRIAQIGETLGQLVSQRDMPIGFAQQRRETVAGKVSNAEVGHCLAFAEVSKSHWDLSTVCSGLGVGHVF